MRATETAEYRSLLQQRRRQLLGASRATLTELAEVRGAERSPEVEDGAQTEQEEMRLANLGEVQRSELERIDAALERLEAGRYGTCVACGATLDRARLLAVPFAQECPDCAADREGAAGALRTLAAGPRLVRRPGHAG